MFKNKRRRSASKTPKKNVNSPKNKNNNSRVKKVTPKGKKGTPKGKKGQGQGKKMVKLLLNPFRSEVAATPELVRVQNKPQTPGLDLNDSGGMAALSASRISTPVTRSQAKRALSPAVTMKPLSPRVLIQRHANRGHLLPPITIDVTGEENLVDLSVIETPVTKDTAVTRSTRGQSGEGEPKSKRPKTAEESLEEGEIRDNSFFVDKVGDRTALEQVENDHGGSDIKVVKEIKRPGSRSNFQITVGQARPEETRKRRRSSRISLKALTKGFKRDKDRKRQEKERLDRYYSNSKKNSPGRHNANNKVQSPKKQRQNARNQDQNRGQEASEPRIIFDNTTIPKQFQFGASDQIVESTVFPFNARRDRIVPTMGARQLSRRGLNPNQTQVNNITSSSSSSSTSQTRLRPIIIDGANVAHAHADIAPRKMLAHFSAEGVMKAVDFFRNRGHRDITVVVPQHRLKHGKCDSGHLLEILQRQGHLQTSPSRTLSTGSISSYDDKFIVEKAAVTGGVIVSNDFFRDLLNDNRDWKEAIEKRLLPYRFMTHQHFWVPTDPLGKEGPNLETFLRF